MRVLLTGATGAAGLGILRTLLTDDAVSQVTVLGRRPALPSWVVLPNTTDTTHPKLTTISHPSFLSYSPDLIAEHDACIWALGKSTRGMNEKDYTELTVGYLDAFLDALKQSGAGTPEKPFRFAFISGAGTDSKERSRILFARVKGRAENHLRAAASASEGKVKSTILRPGYFYPSRNHPADGANLRGGTEQFLDKVASPLFGFVYPAGIIDVEDIGAFSVEAVKGRWDGKGDLFENGEMKKLLKEWRSGTSSAKKDEL